MAITPLDKFLEYKMHLLTDSRHPRLFVSWWQDLTTAGLSAWFFGGLILDVNAHARGWTEDFFTWWHLVFYTGYFATAAWIVFLFVRAHRADGRTGRSCVPHGYGPAVVGIPLFLVSGLADMIWHSVLGVEENLSVLFSPSHLGLAVGGILIVAAPWLAAWRRQALGAEPEPLPAEVRLAAPALSLGYVLSSLVLFLAYVIAFSHTPFQVSVALEGPNEFASFPVAGIVFTTVLVLGTVLLATGRFRLPLGFFTVAFVFPAIMAGAYTGFENGGYAWLFLLSGTLADFLTWLVRPDLRRRRDLITFASAWSVITWAAYMTLTGASAGWPAPEIALGAPVVAALVGSALMLVVQPEQRDLTPPSSSDPSPFDEVMARAKAMAESRRPE